jgi:hypothetical protein
MRGPLTLRNNINNGAKAGAKRCTRSAQPVSMSAGFHVSSSHPAAGSSDGATAQREHHVDGGTSINLCGLNGVRVVPANNVRRWYETVTHRGF